MVLSWLKDEQHLSNSLYEILKFSIVDYVDDVDNGRTLPSPSTPCFAQIVDLLGSGCNTLEQFDAAFHKAAKFAQQYLKIWLGERPVSQQLRDRLLGK